MKTYIITWLDFSKRERQNTIEAKTKRGALIQLFEQEQVLRRLSVSIVGEDIAFF